MFSEVLILPFFLFPFFDLIFFKFHLCLFLLTGCFCLVLGFGFCLRCFLFILVCLFVVAKACYGYERKKLTETLGSGVKYDSGCGQKFAGPATL